MKNNKFLKLRAEIKELRDKYEEIYRASSSIEEQVEIGNFTEELDLILRNNNE